MSNGVAQDACVHRGSAASILHVKRESEVKPVWPESRNKERAWHEAGHAVAMAKLRVRFRDVVLTDEEGRVRTGDAPPEFRDSDLRCPGTFEEALDTHWDPEEQGLIRRLLVTLASGPVSQMLLEGHHVPKDESGFRYFGGSSDAELIRGYALGLVAGESEDLNQVFSSRDVLIQEAVAASVALLDSEESSVRKVAERLLEVGRMDEEEVLEAVGKEGP